LTSKATARVSIRRLLFRWLLFLMLLLLLTVGVIGYPIALFPARAAYDWALMDAALSLSRLVTTKKGRPGVELLPPADILLRTDHFDRIYYSVHDANGAFIAGDAHLLPPALKLMSAGELLYDSTLNDEQIRVAALLITQQNSSIIVQVAETTVKRHMLVRQIFTGVIFIVVLLVSIVIVLVWFGVAKGLEPLQRLREELEARSLRDLRPVPEDHAPEEVQPVVRALNNLLVQLSTALQTQQQFVANAAHQLRTPLAGLRMQVEYALRQKEPAEWLRALQSLEPATDRTVRLANQLLTLARAEVGVHQLDSMRVLELRDVAEEVVGQWMPRAIARGIDLGLELQHATVYGDALLVGELLSNLVDNALRYTPGGGRVTVRLAVRSAEAMLEVEDDGVGIPEADREKVLRRFHRVDGTPGEGCGLGLAIVQEISHLHGGRVEIKEATFGPGTRVIVYLPATDDETAAKKPTR
jgi:two-component system sensor histidine kinase TctE